MGTTTTTTTTTTTLLLLLQLLLLLLLPTCSSNEDKLRRSEPEPLGLSLFAGLPRQTRTNSRDLSLNPWVCPCLPTCPVELLLLLLLLLRLLLLLLLPTCSSNEDKLRRSEPEPLG